VPNTYIKAAQIVQAAVLLLQREIVLPRVVWTQPDANFKGALNDTVTLRVPAVLTARTRTMRSSTGLTADTLTETSVPVALDTHVYSLLNITDEELTLDIADFAAQVLAPQMRAVAEGMENSIVDALEGAHPVDTISLNDFANTYEALIDAGTILNENNVPRAGRVVVAGSRIEAQILSDDRFSKVNESGTTDALRDATITRAAGFTIVGSNAVDPWTAYAMDQYAIAFADVAPALPEGATMKERVSTAGLALRYIRDYNPSNSTGPVDRSLVDAFVGAASVESSNINHRLVEITGGAS
jgi:N4-gp56 family major capsid protein